MWQKDVHCNSLEHMKHTIVAYTNNFMPESQGGSITGRASRESPTISQGEAPRFARHPYPLVLINTDGEGYTFG